MAWPRGNKFNFKHGLSNHPLYRVWGSMKKRCYYPRCYGYEHYGGRGIIVCRAWHEFPPFYRWAMANGYQRGLFLDRIDNDKNYEPANCRFITGVESNRNRRFCKLSRKAVSEICALLRN